MARRRFTKKRSKKRRSGKAKRGNTRPFRIGIRV